MDNDIERTNRPFLSHKNRIYPVLFLFWLTNMGVAQTTKDLAQAVNVFIGSANGGNTNPGAVMPWGMASISPFNTLDTLTVKWNGSPYLYDQKYLSGFTNVNMSGTGCPDLGTVTLMPTTGVLSLHQPHNTSPYSNEVASPGYYAVTLDKFNVNAELSATKRSTISRYRFPKGSSNILLNMGIGLTRKEGAVLERISDTEVQGFKTIGDFCALTSVQTLYFYAKISKSPKESGLWDGHRKFPDFQREMAGANIGAYFTFDTRENEEISIIVGVSYVSAENAKLNADTEQVDFDLDGVREAAKKAWVTQLSKIKVEGGTADENRKFYTALYHTLLHPNVFNDVNGEYPGYGTPEIMTTSDKDRYTIFSLWDTYRNVHPFLSLVYPEQQSAMVNSLVSMYAEGGWLPRWELASMETGVMVGDPSLPVIADTYLRGITDFDIDLAYRAMKHNATATLPAEYNIMRPGLEDWITYGYLPDDIHTQEKFYANYEEMLRTRTVWGSVSTSLEYAIADWNLAQLAKALGKKEDYDLFLSRSMFYKNNFDGATNFMRPKLSNGNWSGELNVSDKHSAPFTEGTTWTYNFFVPHDITGLIKLMGGPKKFIKKLDECFLDGHFDVTNEPDIAYPYLYNYVKGQEWKAQAKVRELINNDFTNAPGGLPGNDDCGTLSTWLLYSMMGFYPDCPGDMNYQLTSPVFDRVEIQLDTTYHNADKFTIESNTDSGKNVGIERVLLNGKPTKSFRIHHTDITNGALLEYDLKPIER